MDSDYYSIIDWDTMQGFTKENRTGAARPWNGDPVKWMEFHFVKIFSDPRTAALSGDAFKDFFRLCSHAADQCNRIPKDVAILRELIPLSPAFQFSDYLIPGKELLVSADEYRGSNLMERKKSLSLPVMTKSSKCNDIVMTKSSKCNDNVTPTSTLTSTEKRDSTAPRETAPEAPPPNSAPALRGKLPATIERLKDIVGRWNAVAATHGLPKVLRVPDTLEAARKSSRFKAALARITDGDWCKDAVKALAMIPSSPFLLGQTGRMQPTSFDFFVTADGVAKIVEKKYHPTGASNTGHAPRFVNGAAPSGAKSDLEIRLRQDVAHRESEARLEAEAKAAYYRERGLPVPAPEPANPATNGQSVGETPCREPQSGPGASSGETDDARRERMDSEEAEQRSRERAARRRGPGETVPVAETIARALAQAGVVR